MSLPKEIKSNVSLETINISSARGDDIQLISLIIEGDNILRNENIIKKDKVVEKTKETEILGLPGDSYEAKIITTIETEIMFYNLFKDNLTIN